MGEPCRVTIETNAYLRSLEEPAREITDLDVTDAIRHGSPDQQKLLIECLGECAEEFADLDEFITGDARDFNLLNSHNIVTKSRDLVNRVRFLLKAAMEG